MQSTNIERVPFNPQDKMHLKALRTFIQTGKWSIHFQVPKGCTNLPYLLLVDAFMELTK